MDLQGVVRRRPGDARAEQLGHAGLDVAALAGILGAGREIGDLAGDVDFDGHHRELVADSGEGDQRLAELNPLARIAQAKVERRLRHADGARRRLDAGGFERLHQLLEPLPLDAAKQVFRAHLEAVEGDLVFLHAAIAQHLDLAARHALGREGFGIGSARFGRKQHGEAAIARRIGVGAHQQGHQIGADGMRDPGLVA